MQVIPVINVQTFDEAKTRIEKAASFFADLPAEAFAKEGWVHIDISDGTFTPNMSWRSPEELQAIFNSLESKPKVEVHIMVENPEAIIDTWLRTG